jgi:ribosome-associated translation inhibitor RaiA
MRHHSERHNLRIQIDTHQCNLPPAEFVRMQDALASLGKLVETFPVCDMHVLVEHNARSNDYSVKTSLFLTGGTLVSSDRNTHVYTAYERCVGNLIEDVRAYKERLGRVEERQKQEKGTHQELGPSVDPDVEALDDAVRDGDYPAFRRATYGYEEPLRRRVGRRVERYPEAAARVGKGLEIADLVEDVFLDAFEAYAQWPRAVRFGDWLESFIDPAIKSLLKDDVELENVRLARTALEAEQGRRGP